MTKTSPVLSLCPVCGNAPRIVSVFGMDNRFSILCVKCDRRVGKMELDEKGTQSWNPLFFTSVEEAVEYWNSITMGGCSNADVFWKEH